MNERIPESIALAFNDLALGGSSDKVYHVALFMESEAWSVEIQYGRRGSALMSQTKCAGVEYLKAKKLFDKIVREKLAKGYAFLDVSPKPQVLPVGWPTPHIRAGSGYTEQPTVVTYDILPPELLDEVVNGDVEAYLDSPDYFMQDKSDGVSRGVIKAPSGEIFGINKLAKPVPLPAELVGELMKIELKTFQIDAELVGTRLICRDMLNADGDMGGSDYATRLTVLEGWIAGLNSDVRVVPTWFYGKRTVFNERRDQRHEGVVFKLRTAKYRPGRSGQHKKYKFIKTLSAMAGEPRANGKDSVELFLWDDQQQWIRCGTVSLIGKPAVKKGDIVEVAYLYAYPSKLMVQARLLSVRDDVEASECTVSQLIYKREDA